jgi:hypothetical protein
VPASEQRRPRVTQTPRAIRVGILLAAISGLTSLATAETCYKDDAGRIVTRRRPGYVEVPCPPPSNPNGTGATSNAESGQGNQSKLPEAFTGGQASPVRSARPAASPVPQPGLNDYVESVPVPDRWRIVDSLPGYQQHIFDPYHRNALKADAPVYKDWFVDLGVFSDSVYESRDVPAAVGGRSTRYPGENDVFGRTRQNFFSQTVGVELVYYKGDTVFKPPEWEFRFTPVVNFNYLSGSELQEVAVNPDRGTTRSDGFLGIQAAFVDKHLRNVSERFDFDSLRMGIQPFSSDFRGFLFQDNQLGARLFGNRDNNMFQYNLAYFRLLEKQTNSGLNDLDQAPRHDDVVVANLYWQDLPVRGFVSQGTVVYNRDREADSVYYDSNGFIERPAALGIEQLRNYDVVYLGYNGDGHFGRWNLTTSAYYAGGHESNGTFVFGPDTISAWFGAFELSRDFDWIRPRLSFLYGSGDKNPFDRKATGFDAIVENPQFAGADTSYWIRQAVPLVGGGGVTLSGRNGILNDLRAGPDSQSNFTNPGIILAGIGADMDILPTLRLSLNCNDLSFVDTQVLEAARNQSGIGKHIGEDVSVSLVYRPLMSQNVVLRTSYAKLLTASGYGALFPDTKPGYFLMNVVFAY